MRIDTDNKTFFMEGSDTGNFFESDPSEFGDPADEMVDIGDYSLQFIHFFSTTVPGFSVITPSPQSLFVEEAAVEFGFMDMGSNAGQGYVSIEFVSFSDITTLTGKGPSAALSYGGLPEAKIPLFESLIGQTLALSQGTGYSAISVQAVPEPSTYCMALAGLGFTGYSMWRRRKRSLTGERRPSTSPA
jgi:hypothetical protein